MSRHGKKQIKPVEQAEKNHDINPIKNEVIGISVVSFSILLAVFTITDKAGKVGIIIKDIFLSILGVGSYIMPIFIFIYGISLIMNKTKAINKKKIIWYVMVMVSFVTLDHIFYQHFSGIPWSYNLKRIYTDSINGNGGGIIGGLFAITLYKMFYIYGAIIISITMFTIFMMLAADVSILLGFKKIISYIIKLFKSKSVDEENNYNNDNNVNNNIVDRHHNRKNVIVNLNDDNQDNMESEKQAYPDGIKIIDSKIDEKINIISQLQDEKINELGEKNNTTNRQNENRRKKSKNEEIPKMDIDMLKGTTSNKAYIVPSVDMLNNAKHETTSDENKEILQNAKKLEETLQSFGVSAKVLQVSKGPTVTRYEIQPSHGVKVSRIVNLADDIALNLAAPTVRIEAPIPGKSAVGIEIPNKDMRGVLFREVIQTSEFQNSQSKLTFAVGMDIEGKPIVSDIAKMPHLLIAGATGSGKSVCINTIIASILYKASPEEVKIIMIDPKVVELNVYNGIPHLMIPVVTDPKKAASALNWAVQEMLSRYNRFAQTGTRDIKGYNSYIKDKKALEGEEFSTQSEIEDGIDDELENDSPKTVLMPMSHIVIIIDELADLMMAAPNEVEDAICRLAQMARAAGMHLIIATQRPSVDVITGVIKANIPSRIAFAVSSQVDSRTILDMAGAEKLLGKGDMLFYPIGKSKPIRVQAPFISDKEVEKIVEFIKQQNKVSYDEEVIDKITNTSGNFDDSNKDGDADELLPQAIDIIVETQQASISMLQRRLRIGFSRAARIIDQMEARDLVGPPEGSKPRKVLVTKTEYEQMKNSMED